MPVVPKLTKSLKYVHESDQIKYNPGHMFSNRMIIMCLLLGQVQKENHINQNGEMFEGDASNSMGKISWRSLVNYHSRQARQHFQDISLYIKFHTQNLCKTYVHPLKKKKQQKLSPSKHFTMSSHVKIIACLIEFCLAFASHKK